jgi:hypothetical protein
MPQSDKSLNSLNDYFHAEFSRADAVAKLLQLHEEQPDVTHVVLRSGSENGTYAVSSFCQANAGVRGSIKHFKLRASGQRLGFCDKHGHVDEFMDLSVLLQRLRDMGALALSPDPRPLF